MKFEEIMQLIDKVSASKLTEFTMVDGEFSITVKSEKQVVVSQNAELQAVASLSVVDETQAAPKAADDENVYIVKSPIVGTFYASKEEGGEPLVTEGSEVKKDTVVAIIEAMKLMNEITAGADGVVSEIMVENGELVEYGQEIMKIRL